MLDLPRPVVVDRARCTAPRLAVLVLHPGSGRTRGGGVRDVTGRLVPRIPAAGGIAGRLSGRLLDLADQVRRLDPPGRTDPERFWRDKSDLAARLEGLPVRRSDWTDCYRSAGPITG
jgi:hypothetical protein